MVFFSLLFFFILVVLVGAADVPLPVVCGYGQLGLMDPLPKLLGNVYHFVYIKLIGLFLGLVPLPVHKLSESYLIFILTL